MRFGHEKNIIDRLIWIMLGFKKFFPLLNSIFMFNFIYLCVCAAYLSECKVGLWQKGFSGSYVNIFSGLRLCLICIFTGKSVHHWFWQMLFLTARCTRKACCISMTTGNCEMSSPVLAEKYLHSERAFKCGDFSFFVWVLCFEMFAIIIQYTQNIKCVVFYCTKPRLQ